MLRVRGALLLPGHSCALKNVVLQLSERDLHIRAGVGVSVASRADLLEVVCRERNAQRRTIKLLSGAFEDNGRQSVTVAHISVRRSQQYHKPTV